MTNQFSVDYSLLEKKLNEINLRKEKEIKRVSKLSQKKILFEIYKILRDRY